MLLGGNWKKKKHLDGYNACLERKAGHTVRTFQTRKKRYKCAHSLSLPLLTQSIDHFAKPPQRSGATVQVADMLRRYCCVAI